MQFEDDGLAIWGVKITKVASELVGVATVDPGVVVGSTIVYGQSPSVLYSVYRVNLTTGTSTLLGTSIVNNALNHADYTATIDEYLMIRVFVNQLSGQNIYGGQLRDAGNSPIARITPDAFMVNDD
ncbi:MAG: hypothetical protein AAF682_25245 [Planctomycetota bacterium]